MKVTFNREYAISSTDVRDINNKEMRQMHELNEKIQDVLNSHKDENTKNKYLSDDDLTLMHAILNVFTKEFKDSQKSAFDEEIKSFNKKAEDHEPVELVDSEDERTF